MSEAPERCDVVIRHGTLIDGTGAPPRAADVAVSGDRIVAVGDLGSVAADREIDANGRAVAPGFHRRPTPTTTGPSCRTPTWRSRQARG